MTEKTVQVLPKVFSLGDLQDLQNSATSLEESGDLENQLGEIFVMLLSDFVSVSRRRAKRERKGLGEENKEIRKIKRKGKERKGKERGGEWERADEPRRTGEGREKKGERSGKEKRIVQIRLGQDSRKGKRRVERGWTGVGRERKGEGTGKEKSKKAKEVRTGQ